MRKHQGFKCEEDICIDCGAIIFAGGPISRDDWCGRFDWDHQVCASCYEKRYGYRPTPDKIPLSLDEG